MTRCVVVCKEHGKQCDSHHIMKMNATHFHFEEDFEGYKGQGWHVW